MEENKKRNIYKVISLILVITLPLFLIFLRFAPLNIINNEGVVLFSLDLYYQGDILFLVSSLILALIYRFKKKKNNIIWIISMVLGLLGVIYFTIAYSFTNIILGIFILLILDYLIYVLMIYVLKNN